MPLENLVVTAGSDFAAVTFSVTSELQTDYELFEGNVEFTPADPDSPILDKTATWSRFLDSGETATVERTFTVNNPPTPPDDVWITANLTSPENDSSQEIVSIGNEFDRDAITVVDCSATPSTVGPGDTVQFSADVSNPNAADAAVDVRWSAKNTLYITSAIVGAESTDPVIPPAVGYDTISDAVSSFDQELALDASVIAADPA